MTEFPKVSSSRPYAFPHIDFKESIIGPLPIDPLWRNVIGVAGEFTRGPRGAVVVSSRQEFAYYYGEDTSPGSIFVRQAMLQGASNFIISRVLPGAEAAEGAIALQSEISPGTHQAVVGPVGDRTTGLTLDFSLVAEVMTLPGEFLGSDVEVLDSSFLSIPNYEGVGFFDFYIGETIRPTDFNYAVPSGPFVVSIQNMPEYADIQLITSTSNLIRGARPGRHLQLDANVANATAAISSSVSSSTLEVLSYAFEYGPGVWGVFVKGRVLDVPVSGELHVVLDAVTATYHTVAFNYRSGDGALLPADAQLGLFDPIIANAEKADWFFTVGTSQSSPIEIKVLTYDEVAAKYTLLNTGILVRFGRPGSTSVTLLEGGRFTVPFRAAQVFVGNNGTFVSSTALQPGVSAETVLTDLRNAILRSSTASSLVADASINDVLLPVSLSFRSIIESEDANRIRYRLSRTCVRAILPEATFTVSGAGVTHSIEIITNGQVVAEGVLDINGEIAFNDYVVLTTDSKIVVTPALTGAATVTIANPYTLVEGAVHTAANTTWVVGNHATDLLYGAPATTQYNVWDNMVGGQSPLRNSILTLFDAAGNPLVGFEALSPGAFGNDIVITVRPMPPGQFRVEVRDESPSAQAARITPEAFVLSNYTVDRLSGLYPETIDSKIIRAYFLPVVRALGGPISASVFDVTPQRKAPPIEGAVGDLNPAASGTQFLREMRLSGGNDFRRASVGERFSERDYVNAIKDLEKEDVSILAVAGINPSDIRYEGAITELLGQAERSTPSNGLRTAVFSAPPRVSPARALSLVSGLSSGRAVLVSGHTSYLGLGSLGSHSVPADGIYAGILAVNPPYVSPAALYLGRAALGVTSVDTKSDPASLDIITRSRVEALHYDQGLRVFKFLNGITTSVDPQERWISVRRMMDQIISDLYKNLLFIRSMPHTPSLRKRVASAVDAYLRNLLREEMIYRYQPTICSEANNTMLDVQRGRLNIRVTVTPLFPADYIQVHVIRDLTDEVSIITQPG